jgi:hypothetical protein
LEKDVYEKIFIFEPYYKDNDEERQQEINHCIIKNIENENIDKIFLFSETEEFPLEFMTNKVEIIMLKEWTIYNKIIKFINSKEDFANSYNIILNSDMYLDNSILLLRKFNIENSCIALSPWSVDKNKILNEVSSQGCWIFKNHIKEFDYVVPMGRPGCEHRFLYELHNKGYILYNLCYDIIVWHKHLSMLRKFNYSTDRVARPYVMIWSNKHKKI